MAVSSIKLTILHIETKTENLLQIVKKDLYFVLTISKDQQSSRETLKKYRKSNPDSILNFLSSIHGSVGGGNIYRVLENSKDCL